MTDTPQRKGFVSPLQKAQAGKIGGGRSSTVPTQEQNDAPTSERQDVLTPEVETESAKKNKRDRHVGSDEYVHCKNAL